MKTKDITARENLDTFFVCTYPNCGKRFNNKFSMNRHTLIHTQKKEYTCEHCSKKFALPQYLKEHTYTHTKDCPYVCGVGGCQKKFKQSGKLSLHRRTHPEYAAKEYSSNTSFNQRIKLSDADQIVAKLRNIEEQVEDNNKDEGKEENKQTEEIKCEVKEKVDESRRFIRQDSGQTTVSMSEECILHQPSIVPFSKFKTGLTKEALELHNAALNVADKPNPLLMYLEFLLTPISSSLKLVLPLPDKIKPQNSEEKPKFSNLDLFQLANLNKQAN